jgi:hypothetical protein
MSVRYTYSSCYRIILLGCSPISILKRPRNRGFQHFFAMQRLLVSLRSTLNYADLCTLPKRGQFTSYFDSFVVKYPVNNQFNGEKVFVFAFIKRCNYAYLSKLWMRPDDLSIFVRVEPVETLGQAQGERLPVYKDRSISYLTQAASVAATGRPASPGARAGNYAKGVRAKFRDGVARSGPRVFLNFDLTPFASSDRVCVQAGATHYKPHRAINGDEFNKVHKFA